MRTQRSRNTIGLAMLIIIAGITIITADQLEFIRLPVSFAQRGIELKPFKPPKDQIVGSQINRAWLQECKPAIYLYPQEATAVNVKVEPKGHFTDTIPQYTAEGWTVQVLPDGPIFAGKNRYDYLYYESALERGAVTKPSQGYSVAFAELEKLFRDLLPKLNLNAKEQADFISYWLTALPQSPYYFVGLMPRDQIDILEQLTVSPTPDSIVRVRFFFEPLTAPVVVEPPAIVSELRTGFSVVEWGGIVDTGEKTFFCSQ